MYIMIDIFNIKPSVISRDLSGKSFLIYGAPKTGKTSNAVKFPKPLIVGFEKGWNMLPNVKAQAVNKWREALEIKRALVKQAEEVERGELPETMYKTIIIDTVSIAYDKCTKYILDKEGVDYLDETESKRGYKETEREFDNFFQELVKAGYTIVAIAHADEKTTKDKTGKKYEVIQPKIDKRGLAVLNGLCDVIGYAALEEDEDGNEQMMLTMRGSKYLVAGSRSRYMSEKIPFTYEALLADMQQAIDKEMETNNATVIDTPTEVYKEMEINMDFEDAVNEIKKIAKAFYDQGKMSDYTKITDKHLGKGKKVQDCTESQFDMLLLILDDLRDKVKELKIEL